VIHLQIGKQAKTPRVGRKGAIKEGPRASSPRLDTRCSLPTPRRGSGARKGWSWERSPTFIYDAKNKSTNTTKTANGKSVEKVRKEDAPGSTTGAPGGKKKLLKGHSKKENVETEGEDQYKAYVEREGRLHREKKLKTTIGDRQPH